MKIDTTSGLLDLKLGGIDQASEQFEGDSPSGIRAFSVTTRDPRGDTRIAAIDAMVPCTGRVGLNEIECGPGLIPATRRAALPPVDPGEPDYKSGACVPGRLQGVSIHAATLLIATAGAASGELNINGEPPGTMDDSPAHAGQHAVADFVPVEIKPRYAGESSTCDAGSDRTVGPAPIMTRAPGNAPASALSLCMANGKGSARLAARSIDTSLGGGPAEGREADVGVELNSRRGLADFGSPDAALAMPTYSGPRAENVGHGLYERRSCQHPQGLRGTSTSASGLPAESNAMMKFRFKMGRALGEALEQRNVPRVYRCLMQIKRVVEARDHR